MPEGDRSVSVVIVHYRDEARVRRAVASCLTDEDVAEVVVVDNGGLSSEPMDSPRVRVIAMPGNVGYGRAANSGLDAVESPTALLMNQDATLREGAVAALRTAAACSGATIVGPTLVAADGVAAAPKGEISALWVAVPPSPAGRWRYVPWVSGAAMFFPSVESVPRFDPRYFMYVSDEELCARVWESGGTVVQSIDAVIVHEGGTAATARWGNANIAARILRGRARMIRDRRGTMAAARFVMNSVASRAARAVPRGQS